VRTTDLYESRVAKPGQRAELAHPTTARAVTTSTKTASRLSIPSFSYAQTGGKGEFERPRPPRGLGGQEGEIGAYAQGAG